MFAALAVCILAESCAEPSADGKKENSVQTEKPVSQEDDKAVAQQDELCQRV